MMASGEIRLSGTMMRQMPMLTHVKVSALWAPPLRRKKSSPTVR
jgi:hypothetical protein